MQFEFEGQTYRIGFMHEVSRRWEDHWKHEIDFTRAERPDGGFTGPAALVCLTCTRRLAQAHPDVDPYTNPFRLSHLSKADKERRTRCRIYRRDAEDWKIAYEGVGRVNRKAGDRYEREAGRLAALRNALGDSAVKPLKTAAWKAYNERAAQAGKRASL
jgi:hypothetical protein